MRRAWQGVMAAGVLMIGCSGGGEQVDPEEPADAGVEEEAPEVGQDPEDVGEDVEREGEEQEEEEQEEEEEVWQVGDPPTGSGPFWPGTGRQQFEELLHGDEVRWERGVQGGHHIWIAAEVEREFFDAMDEDSRRQVRHVYRFEHEDGELLAQASRTGGFRFNEEAEQWRALGLYAVLEAPRRPSTMDDEWIRYVLAVEVSEDEVYEREVWLVSQCCD